MHTLQQKSKISFFEHPEAALNFYHENGYHIEHNIFSPQECDNLIQAAQTLTSAKEGNYRPCMMPHRQNTVFLKAMRKPEITQIISTLVGGIAVGIQSEFFYCKPNTRGFSRHQDNFYVEAAYGVFASAWSALCDTYQEKGGLIVYPGTHKEGTLPVQPLNLDIDPSQDPNANNEETLVPKKYDAFHVAVPKGAVLFIHGHLVHASNPNFTNEWRHVLLTTYIKKGEKFRPGNYAKRTEVELYEI